MKRVLTLFLAVIMVLGCLASCKKYDDEGEELPTGSVSGELPAGGGNKDTASNGETEELSTDEKLITEKINTFLTAYNTGDMDAVLKCLDAKTRNTFQAMLNLLGGVAGSVVGFNVDLSDLFSLGIATSQGDFMGLVINDINVIDSSSACATTVMNLTGAGTKTIYFEMVYEKDGWYIHDMTDRDPSLGDQTDSDEAESGENETLQINYTINDCYSFIDERAWVYYSAKKENEYRETFYYGFIDMQGNVLYSIPAEGVTVHNIGKGAGIVCSETGLVLINENGEVKLESDGRTEIKACGDGYAWVYQNKSTISSLEHLYGVVNYLGEWIEPLRNLQEEGLYDDIEYIGSGFVGTKARDDIVYTISKVDKIVQITMNGICSDLGISFSNGMAFLSHSIRWGDDPIGIEVITTDENDTKQTKTYEISYDCIIYEDGRVVDIGNWITKFYDGKVVTCEKIRLEGGQYYEITDYTKSTPVTVEFTAYPASQIEDFVFNGDYGLVQIRGLDEETYVTMIDTQGKELITPIKGLHLYDFVLAPDGYAYYKNTDEYGYNIVDKNNNVTVYETDWFVSFEENEDIGRLCNYFYGIYYITPNGEKLFDNLKVK